MDGIVYFGLLTQSETGVVFGIKLGVSSLQLKGAIDGHTLEQLWAVHCDDYSLDDGEDQAYLSLPKVTFPVITPIAKAAFGLNGHQMLLFGHM